jgi:hypothetical protein
MLGSKAPIRKHHGGPAGAGSYACLICVEHSQALLSNTVRTFAMVK